MAGTGDPVAEVVARARAAVHQARAEGWTGPPFDPIDLAQRLDLEVVPREDVADARTVPLGGDKARIEFNPARSKGRIKYSVAHEIAHTFFPDYHECVRHRIGKGKMKGDEWQLEMLCNVAAAELLMPVGSFSDLQSEQLGIDHLMDLRLEYAVSSEALLIRIARLTRQPCAMFAASATEERETLRYRLDYAIGSRAWPRQLAQEPLLPSRTTVANCTAIGFTSVGDESWTGRLQVHVEAVGIPPYPGGRLPRVVGIVAPVSETASEFASIKHVKGDALSPHGDGIRIIAHVVNDSAHRWGGGFALVAKKRFPDAQRDFSEWTQANRSNLRLGSTRLFEVDDDLYLFSMVAQRGYRPSTRPRIRYQHLEECLTTLGQHAVGLNASVHMPRIGCGQAGGSWDVVGELIDDTLCRRCIDVTVYDLPNSIRQDQASLFTPP